GGNQRLIAEDILRHGSLLRPTSDVFTFLELAAATDSFNPELLVGEGGFGRVYKGFLRKTNQTVAVKQLDTNCVQGNREFLCEVLRLSMIHHPNLVNLIGYCTDGRQRILVFEYMSNGSLEDHLLKSAADDNKAPLDWQTRMKIATGAAKGLEHLHDVVNPQVVFRDLKAANVLLDAEFNPKLSGFGQAKLGPSGCEQDHVSTRLIGTTYGYCAPEYDATGQLTAKSDIYSFGVMLLQIITGRRVIDNTKPPEEENLVSWAQPLFKDRRNFTSMVDPLLQGNYPLKSLHQAMAVAATCLQDEPGTRPLIRDVATALETLTFSTNEDFSEPEVEEDDE
ncbi:hypothetical protein M569_09726, partial [Genlisea aurea]